MGGGDAGSGTIFFFFSAEYYSCIVPGRLEVSDLTATVYIYPTNSVDRGKLSLDDGVLGKQLF